MIEYEQLKIETRNNKFCLTDCASKLDCMAVTRRLSGQGWTITHVPSGFCFPYTFASESVAEECLNALDKIVIWDGLIETLANGDQPNLLHDIRRVCCDFGGIKGNTYKTAPELRRRLDRVKQETVQGASLTGSRDEV